MANTKYSKSLVIDKATYPKITNIINNCKNCKGKGKLYNYSAGKNDPLWKTCPICLGKKSDKINIKD